MELTKKTIEPKQTTVFSGIIRQSGANRIERRSFNFSRSKPRLPGTGPEPAPSCPFGTWTLSGPPGEEGRSAAGGLFRGPGIIPRGRLAASTGEFFFIPPYWPLLERHHKRSTVREDPN